MIPTDPTDFHLLYLPVVGCSHLRCNACGVRVRNAAALSFQSQRDLAVGELRRLYATADLRSSPLLREDRPSRRLYLCQCERWLETSHRASADPDEYRQGLPWYCEGHPEMTLPHDLDGMNLTAENLADVVARGFHDEAPPRMRAADKERGEWLVRLHERLPAAYVNVLTTAAFAALRDPIPRTRALALRFFYWLETEQDRVFQLYEREPALFVGVPDEVTTINVDTTLEHTVWRIVAPLVGNDGRARDFARELALPGNANVATYYALARHDSAWVVSRAEDIARAAPSRVNDLLASFSQFPTGFGSLQLRERVRKAAGQ